MDAAEFSQRREELQSLVARGRRAAAFLDSPGAREFLEPYPQARRLELLERFKQLGSLEPERFGFAALAIKAGLEEADNLLNHLRGIVQAGETAAYELSQLLALGEEERDGRG